MCFTPKTYIIKYKKLVSSTTWKVISFLIADKNNKYNNDKIIIKTNKIILLIILRVMDAMIKLYLVNIILLELLAGL